MTQRVVNYTYGTGNQVLPNGSIDVRDGIDNLQSFDIFMNADEDTYNQRNGDIVQTVAGAIKSVGFKPGSGDFTTGFTVMPGQRDLAWFDPVGQEWYSYLGVIPVNGHTVAPMTNPVGDINWRVTSEHLFIQSGAGAVTRQAQDKMREMVSLADFVDLTAALADAKLTGRIVEVFSDITVRIPTNSATMQDAVTHLSADKHRTITILIEAGHVLTAPLTLDGGDYSNFIISSEDAAVRVINGALVPFSDRTVWRPVFGADNGCIFPTIDVLIDLTTYTDSDGITRNGSGVVSLRGSNVFVKPAKGCIAGYQGAIAYDAAVINCPDAIFTNGIEAGVTAWSNSSIHADRVDASFSEKYGLRSTEGASLSAKFSKATNCGRHAARAVSSAFLDVSDSDLSYSATNAVYARHSCVVNANNSNLSHAGSLPLPPGEVNAGVYALRGSIVSAIECNVDNSVAGFIAVSGSSIACAVSTVRTCTDGFIALQGSLIDGAFCDAAGSVNLALVDDASTAVLTGLTCANPNTGIRVLGGSRADCRNAVITGSAGTGLSAFGGSTVCADDAVFTGAVTNAIYALGGSVVSALRADCSNSNKGFVAEDGGCVNAKSAKANNCVDGIYAVSGGDITFSQGSATTCTRSVRANSGVIVATGATLTGATSSGVFAEKGSDVNLANSNCRKGASDSSSDIQCLSGSIIRTYTTTGGTNIAKNTPSASGLILG